jgi:putative acetyltransferase
MSSNISLRKIQISDNEQIAKIIREVLTEFGGNKPGTAYYDYDTDHMFEAYQKEGQIYYIVELNGTLAGGCGIKQLYGDEEICELQKLYLLSKSRGQNIGKLLLEKSLEFAEKSNYTKCYLETFPNMLAAIHLYQKYGFDILDSPLGNTGHNGCDVWMIKNL